MPMNEYTLEILARDRLAELRADADVRARARAVRTPHRPVRVMLGLLLMRMGRHLLGGRRTRVAASASRA
jgi:hypothetical protein